MAVCLFINTAVQDTIMKLSGNHAMICGSVRICCCQSMSLEQSAVYGHWTGWIQTTVKNELVQVCWYGGTLWTNFIVCHIHIKLKILDEFQNGCLPNAGGDLISLVFCFVFRFILVMRDLVLEFASFVSRAVWSTDECLSGRATMHLKSFALHMMIMSTSLYRDCAIVKGWCFVVES